MKLWTDWKKKRRLRRLAYGISNLTCPNCGNWRMKTERRFLFPWLTIRRRESSISIRYDSNYHPVTVLCECRICGARFGAPPIVKHEDWRVWSQYQGSYKSEVK